MYNINKNRTKAQQYLSMHRKKELQNFNQIQSIPTEYEKRNCTDIFCLIFGLVFSLILFILAIALFNYRKYYEANFPANSKGNLCGIDQQAYPYVYFVNPPNIDRRLCIQSCPKEGDQSLKCVPTDEIGCRFSNTTGFQVKYYPTQPQQTRSGYFCLPVDESLKQQLLDNSNLSSRQLFYNSIDTIILCFFVAIGFSILYLLAVQFMPNIISYVSVILGWLVILAATICIFTYSTEAVAFKIVIGCLFAIVLIAILYTTIKNLNSMKIHSIFLSYSTKLFKERPIVFIYIPIFLVLLLCFIVILILEFVAFWSSGNLQFDNKSSLFHELKGSGPIILTVFLAIQAIWGLVFLKMAFNFCISGQAVSWYYKKPHHIFQPFKLLICKHLGSVIGGSFIIGFFTFIDFILDFLKPNYSQNPNSPYTYCYRTLCGPFSSCLDLVRTDSMAYINLTGNPFCNSARYCEYLCGRSVVMDFTHSTSRVYRLCAHFLLIGIMLIFAMYVKGVISIYALSLIIVNTIFVSTFFISLHADATQAIQIIFLADEQLARRGKPDFQNNYGDDIERNLSGFKLHEDLVSQIRNQRMYQIEKIKRTKV